MAGNGAKTATWRARFLAMASGLAALTIVLLSPTSVPLAQENAPNAAAEAAAPVQRFTLTGRVERTLTLDRRDLRREPVTTKSVYYSTGQGPVRATFTGTPLWNLLQKAGVSPEPAVKNAILRRTVTVIGRDGYTAVFSGGELDPMFGGALITVAYEVDGRPLGEDGFARLVVPGDQAGGRYVSNIVRIEVR